MALSAHNESTPAEIRKIITQPNLTCETRGTPTELTARLSANIHAPKPNPHTHSALPILQPIEQDDMNDIQQFQLIDGTFTPPEASRVLLALVKSKIDYHRMEKFSHEERCGQDASHSEIRLQELEKLKTTLKEFLASASDSKKILRIKGSIEITPL